MTLVFVYGTLKRHGSNHRFLAGQQFVANARTAGGHALYVLGDYPGMVKSMNGDDFVTGEIWQVDDTCLARLDELEGINEGLYAREPIKLMPPFEGENIQTYVYLRSVEGRPIAGPSWGV